MSIARSTISVMAGLVLIALLMSGCADKNKPKPDPSAPAPPSTMTRIKEMFNWSAEQTPRATVTTLMSDMHGYAFPAAMNIQDLEKLNTTLETGRSRQTNSWVSHSPNTQFAVTPYPMFLDGKNRTCREVTIESLVKGA
ncbi:MAG: hypothetical protein HQL55_20410, partial [Magnetococcales bacterium]|nr:hypothetical protein [Magnetococcales bacterium]